MSTSMRSLLSAVLAIAFLVLLTAPLSGAGGEVRAAHGGSALSADAIKSDAAPRQLPFIKPQVAESVVAERGFEETEAAHPSSPRLATAPLSERLENQSPAPEPEARRALLRVYRL